MRIQIILIIGLMISLNGSIISYSQTNSIKSDSLISKDLKRLVTLVKERENLKSLIRSNKSEFIRINSNDKRFENVLNNFNKLENKDLYVSKDTLFDDIIAVKSLVKIIFFDQYKYDYRPFDFIILIDNKYWLLRGRTKRDKDFAPEIVISRLDCRIIGLYKDL